VYARQRQTAKIRYRRRLGVVNPTPSVQIQEPSWSDPASGRNLMKRSNNSNSRLWTARKTPRAARGESAPVVDGRKSESAEVLLATASDLLTERPTLDISFSDIAARSGLNSALIKYYFGNKEGLFVALVKRVGEEPLRQMSRLLHWNISADEKMRLHVTGIISTFWRYPYLNRLLHHIVATGESKSAEEVADFFVRPVFAAQCAILKEGRETGVFIDVDPSLFYFAVIGASDQIFYSTYALRIVAGEREVTDEFRYKYTEFVVNMILRLAKRGELHPAVAGVHGQLVAPP
jgi:TetR/AcrR family transcriptional regulator